MYTGSPRLNAVGFRIAREQTGGGCLTMACPPGVSVGMSPSYFHQHCSRTRLCTASSTFLTRTAGGYPYPKSEEYISWEDAPVICRDLPYQAYNLRSLSEQVTTPIMTRGISPSSGIPVTIGASRTHTSNKDSRANFKRGMETFNFRRRDHWWC